MADIKSKQSKMTLSQKFLNSSTPGTPDVVPIARPMMSKRFNDNSSNETVKMRQTTTSTTAATTSSGYAYDGLGGRSKFFKTSDIQIPFNKPTSTAATTAAVGSSTSNKMGKTKSSKDLMAPLPVSKTLSRNKSSNLCKFKVTTNNKF